MEPVVVPTFIQNFPAAHDSYRVPKQDRSRPISPRFWVLGLDLTFRHRFGFQVFFLGGDHGAVYPWDKPEKQWGTNKNLPTIWVCLSGEWNGMDHLG